MEKRQAMTLMAGLLGWTVTSFACHFCAKLFLKATASSMSGFNYYVLVLTGLQITFCFALTSHSDASIARNEYFIIITHVCATFTTNWSMSVTYAASTFAIKLMEPLTTAFLQILVNGVRISTLQYICISCVVFGAILFAADDNYNQLSSGTVLAFISNICLSLRNLYIKSSHISGRKYSITDTVACIRTSLLFLFILILIGFPVYQLETLGWTSSERVYIYALLNGSALFHVIYSNISTLIVLKHFSVAGHALANISKRISVVGLLYVTGSKTASTLNFIGLFICASGLVIYTISKHYDSGIMWFHRGTWATISNTARTMNIRLSTKFSLTIILTASICIICLAPDLAIHVYSNAIQKGPSDSRNSYNIKDEFFSLDLVKNPTEANRLSHLLKSRSEVIDEAQRIHMNIFRSLLGTYKYAMLFDYSPSENKGDSAIVVGQVTLLRRLNISVIFACPETRCSVKNINRARDLSTNYTENELVILLTGGGNVIGYPGKDVMRSEVIKRFMRFNIIMFPQSIYYVLQKSHIDFCKSVYASHPKLTFLWRDIRSFNLGRRLFPRVRSLLSPDMAYQIDATTRFMAPLYDILWLKRTDVESPGYNTPNSPDGIRNIVCDWLSWKTQEGNSPMETSFLMTANGLMFLQRGRILITDRLHGHILSTLLGIPHVYIDNEQRKISNYHETWTAGVDNIVLANSSADALNKAKQMLLKLDTVLPKIKGYFTNTC